jgi:hypothetical protein
VHVGVLPAKEHGRRLVQPDTRLTIQLGAPIAVEGALRLLVQSVELFVDRAPPAGTRSPAIKRLCGLAKQLAEARQRGCRCNATTIRRIASQKISAADA